MSRKAQTTSAVFWGLGGTSWTQPHPAPSGESLAITHSSHVAARSIRLSRLDIYAPSATMHQRQAPTDVVHGGRPGAKYLAVAGRPPVHKRGRRLVHDYARARNVSNLCDDESPRRSP